jgi:hypothetical protein
MTRPFHTMGLWECAELYNAVISLTATDLTLIGRDGSNAFGALGKFSQFLCPRYCMSACMTTPALCPMSKLLALKTLL